MGFSGGGSNILKAHKHDGTVSQDGGSLDADNITQMGMAAGDIMYSDGTHLQILNLGSASDTLTVNGAATAPEWASAAAGGTLTLIDNTILGADSSTIDTSFTSLTQGTDMAGILVVFNGARSDTNGFYMRIGTGGSLITTTTYDSQGITIVGGAASYQNSSDNLWYPVDYGTAGPGIQMKMILTASDPSIALTANQTAQFTNIYVDSGNAISFYGGTNSTSGVTSLDQIQLIAPSGTFLEGSQLTLYKIGVT